MSNSSKIAVRKITIPAEQEGQRLDNYLRKILTGVPNSLIYKIIRDGQVRVNSGRIKPLYKLKTNDITDISVNETLSRTVITSLTTLLALFSIFILGGEILKGFSFAMILGVIIGTYSSIYVASPVLSYFKVTQKTLLKEEEI